MIKQWEHKQEVELKGHKIVYGNFLPFSENPNGNGRVYDKESISQECLNHFIERVNDRTAFGEYLDNSYDSDNIPAVINIGHVSHCVTSLEKTDEGLIGEIEILNTPQGEMIKSLLKEGVKLCIRPRATGAISEDGRVEVQEILSFDFIDAGRDSFKQL